MIERVEPISVAVCHEKDVPHAFAGEPFFLTEREQEYPNKHVSS